MSTQFFVFSYIHICNVFISVDISVKVSSPIEYLIVESKGYDLINPNPIIA